MCVRSSIGLRMCNGWASIGWMFDVSECERFCFDCILLLFVEITKGTRHSLNSLNNMANRAAFACFFVTIHVYSINYTMTTSPLQHWTVAHYSSSLKMFRQSTMSSKVFPNHQLFNAKKGHNWTEKETQCGYV